MKILKKNPLTFLIVFGILYRTLVLFFYTHVTIFPDTEGYQQLSDFLSSGNLSDYDGTRGPGYPLLLSVFGNHEVTVILFQLILGIITSLLVFKNLKLLRFSARSSLIFTLLLESLLHVVFYETTLLTEAITFFFIMLIFKIILDDYFFKKSFKTDLMLGCILGYLIAIKSFYIFLPFIIYGFYVLQNFQWKSFINSKIIILLLPLTVFLSISFINKASTGYFVPTTFYGFNIAQNCVYFAEKAPKKYAVISEIYVRHREIMLAEKKDVAMTIWSAYPELTAKLKLSLPDLSFQLSEFSKATIKKNPLEYLRQVALSWSNFWKTAIYWNQSEFRIKQAIPFFALVWNLEHYILKLFKIAFIVNLPLVLIEVVRKRKLSNELLITTVILVTSILQAMSTFGSNARFSYPFEFLMIITVLLRFKDLFKRYNIFSLDSARS